MYYNIQTIGLGRAICSDITRYYYSLYYTYNTTHMRIIVFQAHQANFCVLYSRWRWW